MKMNTTYPRGTIYQKMRRDWIDSGLCPFDLHFGRLASLSCGRGVCMEPTARLSQSEPENTSRQAASSSSDAPNGDREDAGASVKPGLKSREGEGSRAAARKELNSRLEARVFELENRLRETEEELQYYFEFFKQAKKAGSKGGQQQQQQEKEKQPPKNSDDCCSSDGSDLDNDAPSSNHYTGNANLHVASPPRPT